MTLGRFRKWLRSPRSVRRGSGVLPADEFREILEREEKSAHRSGARFSVVTFDLAAWHADQDPITDLALKIHDRVRTTDQMGWLDREHLALLLPNTPAAGAAKLVEHIRRDLASPSGSPPIETAVYAYPPDVEIDHRHPVLPLTVDETWLGSWRG